jgi:diguanylate cyclase (GGDEF)-like protein
MSENKPMILIVDNEIEICNLFKDFFDFMGYDSMIETDGGKVLHGLESFHYDLMFVDLKLGSVSGVDILRRSKAVHPDAEVMVVTGFGSEETVLRTLNYGAFAYIQKPISFSEIKIQTEEALAKCKFNAKTSLLKAQIKSGNPVLLKHLDNILSLDRFSTFLNLSIDIESLADSILNGMANILPGYYYSLLFFDDVNREIVMYSTDPISRAVTQEVESHIKKFFENLVNRDLTELYHVRVSIPTTVSEEEGTPKAGISSFFVPLLVENAVRGAIGLSSETRELDEEGRDMLRLISSRANKVLTNATVHRDTKMLALTDGLTGLLNHRAFHDRIKQEFERYRRYGAFLSLIVADFDDLKAFNDTYGHPVGDEVLRKIGDILRETSRESDVLARYGGDEFVILLPQTNAKNAKNMAERIRQKVENYVFTLHDVQVRSTISIGVSTVPDNGINSSQDLLESADRALYEAKRSGKNRIMVAGSSILQ